MREHHLGRQRGRNSHSHTGLFHLGQRSDADQACNLCGCPSESLELAATGVPSGPHDVAMGGKQVVQRISLVPVRPRGRATRVAHGSLVDPTAAA
eukprot:13025647-Alexandrium_andersonii.AAC.1